MLASLTRATDILLNVFLAIAVDNLADAQSLSDRENENEEIMVEKRAGSPVEQVFTCCMYVKDVNVACILGNISFMCLRAHRRKAHIQIGLCCLSVRSSVTACTALPKSSTVVCNTKPCRSICIVIH